MIAVKRLHELPEQMTELNCAVHTGEAVLLRINRGGFSLEYRPTEEGQFRTFAPVHPLSLKAMSSHIDCGIFAAESDGNYCGLASIRDLHNGWAEINDLRVDASFRRQGAGRALLASCRSFAEHRGLGGLYVAVSDNNAVLCQFLEHEGFRVEGIDRQALALLP